MAVSMTVELQQIGHHLFFRTTHIEHQHPRHRRQVFTIGQNDRLERTLTKEGRMLKIDACRHEEVRILIGLILYECFVAFEGVDGADGNEALQQSLQTTTCQHVVVNYRHAERLIPHSHCLALTCHRGVSSVW